jgi:Co/Zn/Cd efflux system component
MDDSAYRRIVWICLSLNLIMFFVQTTASFYSGSAALLASSVDFMSDALNYGISLFVLGKSVVYKARATMFKGICIASLGLFIAATTVIKSLNEEVPSGGVMWVCSVIALFINILCAGLLYKYRCGDSNAMSVWLCSRNDAIENVLVIAAGISVLYFSIKWPDILVAAIIVYLSLTTAYRVIILARNEMRAARL